MIENINWVEIAGIAAAAGVAVGTVAKILSLRRIVPADMVHVAQTTKKTTSYGKASANGNVYYKWPRWMPVLGVEVKELPTNIRMLNLPNFPAYDKDRVPFLVDITAFYRVSNTDTAAERIESIDKMENQFDTIVKGAIRNILAQSKLETIMEERSEYGKKFTEQVAEDLKQWGIETAKNIELMDIRDDKDSEVIKNIMEKQKSQIEKESRVIVAKNMQEAQEAEIESSRIVEVKRAEKDELVGKRNAEKDQQIGIATEKAKQQVAEESKITTEKDLAIEQVKKVTGAKINQEQEVIDAETVKKKTIIQAGQNKEKMVIDAEAEKEQTRIKAEGEKLKIVTVADAKLEEAKKESDGVVAKKMAEAKGVKEVGLAAADAEKQMQLAHVTAKTTLADKIGGNKEYQEYLVNLETVKQNANIAIKSAEFSAGVGKEQAKALEKANVSVVANTGGSIQSGLKSVGDLFTPEFATQLGAADTALKNATGGTGLVDALKELVENFALAKGTIPINAPKQR